MEARKKKRVGQSFLQGALILTASMAMVKIIGALFKIPLAGILGGEGNGYFLSAYSLYNPIYTLATAGFPIAISRLVSENVARNRFQDVRQIHRVSIPIFFITGTLGFLLMSAGTFAYVQLFHSPGSKYAMLVLAPTILFVCLMSIYRGYYEGLRNMVPTAISEIIEAVCKLLLGLSVSSAVISYAVKEYENSGTVFGRPYETQDLAMSAALPYAAAGAIVGITIGAFLGFIFLVLRHKIKGDGITPLELKQSPPAQSAKTTVKKLISVAIPIGLGALVVNLSGFVDSTMIQLRLNDLMQTSPESLLNVYGGLIPPDKITNHTTHTYLYGCYGYASNIMMLIPAITQMFGISALPTVTAAWASGNHNELKKSIETVLRVTTLITIPAGLGISVLAKPILRLLYASANVSNEVEIASKVLVIMGIAAIFWAVCTPVCSMLQAVGRVDLPVKLLAIGVLLKVLLNYFLVGIPEVNVQGAGIGTLVCYAFVSVCAYLFLCRETHIHPRISSVFIKPLAAALFCAVSAYASQGLYLHVFQEERLATIGAMITAALVYCVALFALRAVTAEDISMLPKGQKIAKLLEKHKWIG